MLIMSLHLIHESLLFPLYNTIWTAICSVCICVLCMYACVCLCAFAFACAYVTERERELVFAERFPGEMNAGYKILKIQ